MTQDKKIYLYTRFERFWHWVQAILIFLLLISGLEVHGVYSLFGFENAFNIHNYSAWSWLILYAFIVFWLLTTGEWKQFTPTYKKLLQVIIYYVYGIFKGLPHPVPKSKEIKHNPLQRLTYLGIVSFLVPFQLITGFLYYYYNSWPEIGFAWTLQGIALLHTAGGFAMLIFILVHIYMTTTGPTIFSHTKSMLTGWEEGLEEKYLYDWEKRTKQ